MGDKEHRVKLRHPAGGREVDGRWGWTALMRLEE